MSARLVTLICWTVIFYLFWKDRKQSDDTSTAQWVPLLWMFFAGTRFLGQWINLLGGGTPRIGNEGNGSPIDAAVFLTLMIAGMMILWSRPIAWSNVLTQNKLVWLFFAFALCSVLWSPDGALSFKRWFKALGNVIMALVLLTEPKPFAAIGSVIRRLAFIALPISILFIKYYPQYGRAYHMGEAMFTGIAAQKNTLGQLCLLTGIYCVWSLAFNQSKPIMLVGRRLRVEWALLGMLGWLLYMADSATSLMCLMVAVLVLVVSQVPVVRRGPRRILGVGFVVVLVVSFLEWTADLSATILHLFGRDSNLTTRVPTWLDLLAMMDSAEKRMLGYGFEIFWETRDGAIIFDKWYVFNAHNGYLDTYLSLGYIGVFLLIASILWTVPKVFRHLSSDRAGAMLRLTLILVVALYNWSESTFKSVDNMWLMLFLASMNPPAVAAKAQPAALTPSQRKRGLSAA